jgi:hypothetical protein
MKSYALLFSALFAFSFSFSSSLQAQTSTSRVLVIGIDGTRSDAMTLANTPNLDALMAEGVYSPNALNDGITISGPGWSDILCGVGPEKHLSVDNSFVGTNYSDYPSFFQRVESAYPDANTVSVCHWGPINDYIVMSDADLVINTTSDAAVRDAAIDELSNGDPHAIFLHFDDVDYAGHSSGFNPEVPQYITAIETVDMLVGYVIGALQQRENYESENWLVIVTHDHGGVGYSHGGTSVEHREVSFIASGLNVPQQLVEKTVLETTPPPMNCLGGDGLELVFGANSNVSVGPFPDLNAFVEQDFSVEIRVRTTSTADVAIIGNKDWDTGLNQGFVFSFEYPGGPAWKVNVGDGVNRADVNGAIGIGDGEWHTLSVTFDLDGMMTLYTDGVFSSQENISGVGNLNTEAGLFMGADINGAYQYNGSIAEVRIWQTILEDAAIADYACSSIDVDHPNYMDLFSYWKMTDNYDYLQNSSPFQPFLVAIVNGAEWQTADSTVVYDYSGTPRLVDVSVTAMTHLCIDVLPEWDLDGISWVEECTDGIDDPEGSDARVSVYPNPASDALWIQSEKMIEKLVVRNALGSKVLEESLNAFEYSLNVEKWKKGLYFVEVISQDGTISYRKIIVN